MSGKQSLLPLEEWRDLHPAPPMDMLPAMEKPWNRYVLEGHHILKGHALAPMWHFTGYSDRLNLNVKNMQIEDSEHMFGQRLIPPPAEGPVRFEIDADGQLYEVFTDPENPQTMLVSTESYYSINDLRLLERGEDLKIAEATAHERQADTDKSSKR